MPALHAAQRSTATQIALAQSIINMVFPVVHAIARDARERATSEIPVSNRQATLDSSSRVSLCGAIGCKYIYVYSIYSETIMCAYARLSSQAYSHAYTTQHAQHMYVVYVCTKHAKLMC